MQGLDVTADDIAQVFATTPIGPLMLTQSLLKRAASHASHKPLGWQRATVINIWFYFI